MTNENAQAYPLQWPLGRQRTKSRTDNYQFRQQHDRQRHSVGKGVENILAELRRMGATDVVISSNIALRADGLPRSGQGQPADPGVAVYFKYDQQPVALCCDQWTKVEDNLWSIFLTLEAMRGIDRWGAAKLQATFTGYAALPAPDVEPWWQELGVTPIASVEEIRGAYRTLVKQHHPDAGGNHDRFIAIQGAYERAMKERGQ